MPFESVARQECIRLGMNASRTYVSSRGLLLVADV